MTTSPNDVPAEGAGVTLTFKLRLAKFDGDDTTKDPVEVVETEHTVPLTLAKEDENGSE